MISQRQGGTDRYKTGTIRDMRLLLLLLTLFSYNAYGNEINLTDSEGNDITIQVTPADGGTADDLLVDHDEHRPLFERLLSNIAKAGIEVWRIDLLEALFFLPRSSEQIRTLNGNGVAAILRAAHQQSNKRIVLASYDRMPLPLLRGVHQWQSEADQSRLAGAVLFYPNLFGPAPIAGEAPTVDPILYATNTPLMIYQPSLGSHRLRMNEVLSALWQSGLSKLSLSGTGRLGTGSSWMTRSTSRVRWISRRHNVSLNRSNSSLR